MPFITAQLIPNNQQLVTVTESDSVQYAIALMTEYDFSQLPVIENGILKGIITSDSILKAVSCFGVGPHELKVSHATHSVKPCRDEDDLSDVLKGLQDSNGIPIVDKQGHVVAIVTNYDSAEYFRRRAEDLMLVEDIEITLRDFIEAIYCDDDGNLDQDGLRLAIKDVTPSSKELHKKFKQGIYRYLNEASDIAAKPDKALVKKVFEEVWSTSQDGKKFDQLTLSEYITLFQSQWSEYHQSLFRDMSWTAMFNLLDEVRKTRNAIAHFREVTPEQREKLKFCINFLDRHRTASEEIAPDFDSIDSIHTDINNSKFLGTDANELLRFVTSTLNNAASNGHVTGEEILGQVRNLITRSEHIEDSFLNIFVSDNPMTLEVLDNSSDVGDYHTSATFGMADEEVLPNDSRYAPLAIWLQGQDTNQVSLGFEDIENIIQDKLPPSARNHRHWWANDSVGHVQSRQWLDAGWSVSNVNMNREKVTFSRIGTRQKAYVNFFSALYSAFESLEGISIGGTTQPQGRNCVAIELRSDDLPRMFVAISFARRSRLRLEHYIGTPNRDFNKQVFDTLQQQQSAIERELGHSLSWERLYGKVGCRIALYRDNSSIEADESSLAEMREWLIAMVPLFYRAMSEKLLLAYTKVSNQLAR